MTRKKRRDLPRRLAPLALVLLAAVTLAGTYGWRDEKPARQVVLETRGRAFSGPEGQNPTIEAQVGEKIRFVVRNTDSGVLHSISVPELSKRVETVRWGEQGVLEITAEPAGTFVYSCPQHCPKMRGKLVVRE